MVSGRHLWDRKRSISPSTGRRIRALDLDPAIDFPAYFNFFPAGAVVLTDQAFHESRALSSAAGGAAKKGGLLTLGLSLDWENTSGASLQER